METKQVIQLKSDFYRDGFRKVMFALGTAITIVVLLLATSIYLLLDKPSPVNFSTDSEWRILKPVPVDQPFISTSDLVQWVSNTLLNLFNYDFVNYKTELEGNTHYFTENGWKKFLDVLNGYAAYNTVVSSKLFINGGINGAPYVLNEGLLAGRYSWWVQGSANLKYSSGLSQILDMQILVVRVSTLNNLDGIAIENIVPLNNKPTESKVTQNENE
jgi:intracellular multiplication protein IcmL